MGQLVGHVVQFGVRPAGHVQLDGHRLAPNELLQPAELVEHGGKYVRDLPVVFRTDPNGYAA